MSRILVAAIVGFAFFAAVIFWLDRPNDPQLGARWDRSNLHKVRP